MRSLAWTTAGASCIGAAFFGSGLRAQGVVINEYLSDESVVDARECVELYNASASSVDISGWMLESRDAGGSSSQFVIPNATVLPAGGFYVLGSALVANVDQVVGTTDI